jgi:hypothetical protein
MRRALLVMASIASAVLAGCEQPSSRVVSTQLQAAAPAPHDVPAPLLPRGLVTKASSVSPGYVLFSQSACTAAI